MTKIFFDHQKFSTQKYGGISRYFANILTGIKSRPDFDYKLGVLLSDNYYLKRELKLSMRPTGIGILDDVLAKKSYQLNELYCNYLLKENKFDIFHPTYYDTYFIKKVKRPVVITIHDMTYERLPQYFWSEDKLTSQKRQNIERADKIIAISETTKRDLVRFSKADPDKISVIYHGIDNSELVFKHIKGLPPSYLLFVGDRGGYKNFHLFLKAFKQLEVNHPGLKVVLTGGGEFGISEKEFIRNLELGDKIAHITVTDEELNYLYSKALLFVYPSLHEGFGYPILEAFKAGCPVVLSDTECFREVGSEAAAYFAPLERDDLVQILDKLLSDISAREELIRKGTDRLKDFPLDISVAKTLDIYKSMT
ncbi:MAG: glycosyltransferase family 4 protein [Daejeonella sp.]